MESALLRTAWRSAAALRMPRHGVRSLWSRVLPRRLWWRPRMRIAPLSAEWLRTHEVESRKRLGGE